MVLGAARFTEAPPFSKGMRNADMVDRVQQALVVGRLKVMLYTQIFAGAGSNRSLVDIESWLTVLKGGDNFGAI